MAAFVYRVQYYTVYVLAFCIQSRIRDVRCNMVEHIYMRAAM
ncbi:hypothetical protein APHMUC_0491 [Anaplasma phagocytophilum str. ApMUC09]|uniref:Uncharacterized protein n=1 Tax=Anaplasma phagocytophilum str. ApMUC09 TaxID=1359152 RepID=A0A0F3N7J4_ANAPH|nr:hypothetical protein APHMUC_0491 [Anaplasma phagocytophilum str. ApMUC09]